MDITPPLPAGINFINSYSDKGFKVNGKQVVGDVVLSPTENYPWEVSDNIFAPENYRHFIEYSLAKATANPVILIGTGVRTESAPHELFRLFEQYNAYPEVMLTTAACRTYNVLVSEQRNVFALLKKL